MTKKEIINRNIGVTFDFLRQIVEDPSLLKAVPNNSTLEFVEKDFSTIEKNGSRKKANRKYLRVKSELEVLPQASSSKKNNHSNNCSIKR